MKILTVIGARPQFVKASVVSQALKSHSIHEVMVHTGQHYDPKLSQVFFDELQLPHPQYELDIGSGQHGAQTGAMLSKIESILLQEQPDIMLVYGDTNSTLAGSLAAAKCHIPIAHVEAGLRSYNNAMPEEINRILTDRVSTWLFTPTTAAANNLAKEGVNPNSIYPVGDVMKDVAHYFAPSSEHSNVLEAHQLTPNRFILATIHRASNTDDLDNLTAIFTALNEIAHSTPVVVPLHPRTQHALKNAALSLDAITFIDPQGFLAMMQLEKNAALIVTDSGGVQKEAFFHQKPCITLRNETEWVELVDNGWNRLVDPSSENAIKTVIQHTLDTPVPTNIPSLYGDGHAADKIAAILLGVR